MTDSPFGGLSVEELIELKLDFQGAAQKALRAYSALLEQHRRKTTSSHSLPEEIKGGELELKHADFMLRTAAKKVMPVLEILAEESKV